MDSDELRWAKVLELIYSNGGSVIYKTRMPDSYEWEFTDSSVVNQDDQLGIKEVSNSVALLTRAGLIEEKREHWEGPPDHVVLELTKKGFDVAHQREVTEKQQETNESLVFFTFILGGAAIVQSVAAALQVKSASNQLALLLLVLILTLGIAAYQSREQLRTASSTFTHLVQRFFSVSSE